MIARHDLIEFHVAERVGKARHLEPDDLVKVIDEARSTAVTSHTRVQEVDERGGYVTHFELDPYETFHY